MRIYLLLRTLATGTLALYVILRSNSDPSWLLDLIVFNMVGIIAIFSLMVSPIPDDRFGRLGTSLAILIWTLGSVISSIDTFFALETILNLELLAQVAYALFYPCALFGLSRAIRYKLASRSLEILDTLIITLGCTTIVAAFLIRPAMTNLAGSSLEVFLSILYPVGDIVLLVTVLTLAAVQKFSLRNLLLIAGIGAYSISDFYFLFSTQSGSYQYGSLTDIGWLIGFVIISEAFWHNADERQAPRTFNPAVSTIALLGSSAILAIAVLQPDYFPRFLIVPAFATIALSFLRMGVAINDARNMSNEQILARTDELTGLANRRRFIVEFEEFLNYPGSVLILDLDGFKPVNDTRGHDVGDQLLSQVARRFERVIPHGSLLARLGGDEFGALIRGNDGLEIARALRGTLSYPFHIAGAEVALDVSIGEATNTPGENLADQLMRRADDAMYEAKRSKRGVVAWHDQLGARGLRL